MTTKEVLELTLMFLGKEDLFETKEKNSGLWRNKTTEVETDKQRVSMDELCQRRVASATSEANTLLENTRAEASRLSLEATQKYNDMLGEAKEAVRRMTAETEERCNKMVFEAESRATSANAIYENAVKKAAVHRKQVLNLLKTQMEMVQDFEDPSNC